LILMDMSLPELDGWETTRRLRADAALRHIPVIALTAAAADRDRRRGLDAGFHAYLTKPVDVDELIATIRKAVG
ncbi:MAG TPA: response regulator, partial [Kofleriaceae bacterium]